LQKRGLIEEAKRLLSRTSGWELAPACAILFAGGAVFLAWPPGMYSGVWTQDLFIFLDGAYRFSLGQTPHVDYSTPLGLLCHLLPHLGHGLGGSWAKAMAWADIMALLAAMLVAFCCFKDRLGRLEAGLMLALVWLLVAVPLNIRDPWEFLTYAVFYNRWGWAFMTMGFLFYLPPSTETTGRAWLDGLGLGLTLAFLLYLKISYFLIVLVVALFLLTVSRHHRRAALIALAMLLAAAALVEIVWPGLNAAYYSDLKTAVAARGAVRGGLYSALKYLNLGAVELILFGAGVWAAHRLGGLGWRDLVFAAMVLGASLATLNQNAQVGGMVTLAVVIVWSLERARTGWLAGEPGRDARRPGAWYAALLVTLALFLSPYLVNRAVGAATFWVRSRPMPANQAVDMPAVRGMYVLKSPGYLSGIAHNAYTPDQLHRVRKTLRRDWLADLEYVETLEAGQRLLEKHREKLGRLVVLDYVAPFYLLLRLEPPRGIYHFFFNGFTFDTVRAPPSPGLLQRADSVMVARYPVNQSTRDALLELYESDLRTGFNLADSDRYWDLYLRRGGPEER